MVEVGLLEPRTNQVSSSEDAIVIDDLCAIDEILSGTDANYPHFVVSREVRCRPKTKFIEKVDCNPTVIKFSEWLKGGLDQLKQWTVDLVGRIYIIDASELPENWDANLKEHIGRILSTYYENYKPFHDEDRKALIEQLGFKVIGPIDLPEYIETAEHNPVDLDYSNHYDKKYHEARADWTLEDQHAEYNKLLKRAGARPAECGSRTIITRNGATRLYCGNFRACPRCFESRLKLYYSRVVDAICLTLHSWYEIVVSQRQYRSISRNLTAAGVYWVNFPMEDGNHMLIPTTALIVLKDKLEELKPQLLTPETLFERVKELCHTPEGKRVRFSANFPVNELTHAVAFHKQFRKAAVGDSKTEYGTYIVDAPIEKVVEYFLKRYHFNLPEHFDDFDLQPYTDDEFFETLLEIAQHHKMWMYANGEFIEVEPWLIRTRWKSIRGSQGH